MARRIVSYPAVILTALTVFMLAGSVFVSSTVQVFLVGTSWLGLAGPPGVGLSVSGAVLSMMAVAAILFVALRPGYGDGNDDDGFDDDEPPPAPEGPEGEPAWWPEFEREFAAYSAERDLTLSGHETFSGVR